jgi:hypothetical protein
MKKHVRQKVAVTGQMIKAKREQREACEDGKPHGRPKAYSTWLASDCFFVVDQARPSPVVCVGVTPQLTTA